MELQRPMQQLPTAEIEQRPESRWTLAYSVKTVVCMKFSDTLFGVNIVLVTMTMQLQIELPSHYTFYSV